MRAPQRQAVPLSAFPAGAHDCSTASKYRTFSSNSYVGLPPPEQHDCSAVPLVAGS